MSEKPVITRIAPSPTGYFHVGTARTALYNYLFAQQNKGKFLVRIEDTDKERSDEAHTKLILDGLEWLGLKHDGGIVMQSANAGRHKEILNKMIEDGFAYVAEESDKGTGKVIRFKNPNEKVTFTDMIRGEVTFDTTELKDFVIAKNIDEPLFHLAVVVDDFDAGVTHIIRGEDHISNTPRQILIQRAIGAPDPIYAHLPLLLAPDKTKLSKRKGAKSLTNLQDEGILPEAVINYLALLGWNPGTDQEIFTIDELIKAFDITKVQKGGAIFSEEKLEWVNREHIKAMSPEKRIELFRKHLPELVKLIESKSNDIEKIIDITLERNNTFGQVQKFVDEGGIDFVLKTPEPTAEQLLWKNNPDKIVTAQLLQEVTKLVETVDADNFTAERVKDALWPFAEEKGKGDVLWPTRVALSGKEKSPDPFLLADILGKEEVIKRLNHAIDILS